MDKRESTRRCLKYRRGRGRILIVNHEGRGWWDPLSPAKGDVFDLVRQLDPTLGFGQVCDVLRAFVGLGGFDSGVSRRSRRRGAVPLTPDKRWAARQLVTVGSPAWGYLAGKRGLPASVLARAARLALVREGPRASAWFAHRDRAGCLTGIEMRGPAWRGFSAEGTKSMFRLPGGTGQATRLAVAEAAIDALSLAALEQLRPDTLYTAVAGGMGPLTLVCLEQELRALTGRSDAVLAAATDADAAGERTAARLSRIA